MDSYKKNIILIMSAGIGSRFGTDCPKQYNYMGGRQVIDYVFEACRKSTLVDEIVIVASGNYIEQLHQQYAVPVVAGGASRPESVANGVKYIHEHYDCDKLIITNSVCPLASTEQYDKYFCLLDDYDYVLTTWKLAPALHRFDGTRVDRDDFFNVMEPDAYRFGKLYENYDFKNLKKYIFHNMPENSNGYYCFDYPYTMKVTYPYDIPILETLYENIILKPTKEQTIQTVNKYLSASAGEGIITWIKNVQMRMKEDIAPKYGIVSYTMNSQTEANIVFEAESVRYGSIIVKFTPSDFFFHKEYTYYQLESKEIMADLLGSDKEYNALILKSIRPGMQVKFNRFNKELRTFFDKVNMNLIPGKKLEGDDIVPNIKSEFEEYVESAEKRTFAYNTRKALEKKARFIYSKYFDDQQIYYLHRDLHRRNVLKCGDSIRAIDPRGALGPREFEYVIQAIIEIRIQQEKTRELFWEMFDYFKVYVDEERYLAALFYFFVYKANDYTFQKNDNNQLAKWCLDSICALFFDGSEEKMKDAAVYPDFRQILLNRKRI